MRSVLIDTHVLLWAVEKKNLHNIGKKAIHILSTDIVYVSSLSIAEIEIKLMTGKLRIENVINSESIASQDMLELVFSANHTKVISDFESLVGHDPFDRMLLAQARSEGMDFLTADEKLLSLGLDFVINARK